MTDHIENHARGLQGFFDVQQKRITKRKRLTTHGNEEWIKFSISQGSISQCLIRAKIVSKSFMQHVDGCIAADFFFERQPLNQQNQLAPSILKDLPSTLKELHLSTTVSFHSILSKFLSKSFVISNQNSGY